MRMARCFGVVIALGLILVVGGWGLSRLYETSSLFEGMRSRQLAVESAEKVHVGMSRAEAERILRKDAWRRAVCEWGENETLQFYFYVTRTPSLGTTVWLKTKRVDSQEVVTYAAAPDSEGMGYSECMIEDLVPSRDN